jgi:hypothetical protein
MRQPLCQRPVTENLQKCRVFARILWFTWGLFRVVRGKSPRGAPEAARLIAASPGCPAARFFEIERLDLVREYPGLGDEICELVHVERLAYNAKRAEIEGATNEL